MVPPPGLFVSMDYVYGGYARISRLVPALALMCAVSEKQVWGCQLHFCRSWRDSGTPLPADHP
jgi:hypothetical protein